MQTSVQAITIRNIEIVDNLTLLHSRTSAILAALSVSFDNEHDGLPHATVQEVLEATQALLKNAQEEVRGLQVETPLT